jgi:hypothetical protein
MDGDVIGANLVQGHSDPSRIRDQSPFTRGRKTIVCEFSLDFDLVNLFQILQRRRGRRPISNGIAPSVI